MTDSSSKRIVIVGAGQAGFQVSRSLRDEGFAGSIVLTNNEPFLPYQRPPLSKAYLAGTAASEGLAFRVEDFYKQQKIEMVAAEVVRIERDRRIAHCSSGLSLPYDHLVFATGARNRSLSTSDTRREQGVMQLRTLADADELRENLARTKRVVVIGGGFIGLEFAHVAATKGIDVTVLEAGPRLMGRAVSPEISQFFRNAHEAAGIRLVFDAVVDGVIRFEGKATGVRTRDGRSFPADLILVGIGVLPNVDLAAGAGLEIADGIVVDEYLATSDPSVSALGDCASFPHYSTGGSRLRLESVQNALDQARCLAARLTGRPAPYRAVPWFWSDQGPLKLQIVGIVRSGDIEVVRGKPETQAFSVFNYRHGTLCAVQSVNRPGDHMAGRKILGSGALLAPEQAADEQFSLRNYLIP